MESVLKLPSLGQDVQLGMLYDFRTSSFFSGASLWNDADINGNQETIPTRVQNAEYKLSDSLDKSRKNAGLTSEASLNLDLCLVKATGSAKYLSEKKSSVFEARVDVSCTVERRTRRIPQEKLVKMSHKGRLSDHRFTHYVAEVVEGGTATLSFSQICKSAEDMLQVQNQLEMNIKTLPVWEQAEVNYTGVSDLNHEKLRVTYSGAIVESVSTMEDARRVACGLPEKLAQQMNTLSYVLISVSVLDDRVSRQLCELDAVVLERTSKALAAGDAVGLDLEDLHQCAESQKSFPMIQKQIYAFKEAFQTTRTEFCQAARRLLPELRDGRLNSEDKTTELEQAVVLFEQRTHIAKQFVTKKRDEEFVLMEMTKELLSAGFEDHLSTKARHTPLLASKPRLMISFSGADINLDQHPLQQLLISPNCVVHSSRSAAHSDKTFVEEHNDRQTLRASALKLHKLRERVSGIESLDVEFGVCNVDKAFLPGTTQPANTQMGDIILDHREGVVIVTNHIPGSLMQSNTRFAPIVHDTTSSSVAVTIPWTLRGKDAESAIPTTAVVVRCRMLNTEEAASEVLVTNKTLDSAVISNLKSDCDFEVQICLDTNVGPTEWSAPTRVRTLPYATAGSPGIGIAAGAGFGTIAGTAATGVVSCAGIAGEITAAGALAAAGPLALAFVVPTILGAGIAGIVETCRSRQHESLDACEARHCMDHKRWVIATEEGCGNVRVCRYSSKHEAEQAFSKVWCSRVLYDPERHEIQSAGLNGWAIETIRRVMAESYFDI